uniref:Uncharacterized protein n=1 Tax=Anguilla anguilla TaxID=7936 RepID=A0A0E9SMU0_ANGAN
MKQKIMNKKAVSCLMKMVFLRLSHKLFLQ